MHFLVVMPPDGKYAVKAGNNPRLPTTQCVAHEKKLEANLIFPNGMTVPRAEVET